MYKGDLPPQEAYDLMQRSDNAVLIDVRTDAEWAFVGFPAVENLIRLSWQAFPTMERNGNFVADVEAAGVSKDADVFLICRSGARSASAAAALTEAGFENCYNVAEGFEGDKDASGRRGSVGGWKHAGLPWIQG